MIQGITNNIVYHTKFNLAGYNLREMLQKYCLQRQLLDTDLTSKNVKVNEIGMANW